MNPGVSRAEGLLTHPSDSVKAAVRQAPRPHPAGSSHQGGSSSPGEPGRVGEPARPRNRHVDGSQRWQGLGGAERGGLRKTSARHPASPLCWRPALFRNRTVPTGAGRHGRAATSEPAGKARPCERPGQSSLQRQGHGAAPGGAEQRRGDARRGTGEAAKAGHPPLAGPRGVFKLYFS